MIRQVLCALAWFCAGSNAAAQEADIPTPESGASVQAWFEQYIEADGWTVIGADGVAVALGGPDGVAALPDGTLRATIRHEYYTQRELGGHTMRSLVQTRFIDCTRRMYRVVSMTIYPRSNMQGASATRENANAEWSAASQGSLYLTALDRICAAPTEGQRLQ